MSVAITGNLDLPSLLRLIYGANANKRIQAAHHISERAARGWLSGERQPSRLDERIRQLRRDLVTFEAELAQAKILIDLALGEAGTCGYSAGSSRQQSPAPATSFCEEPAIG